MHHPAHPAESEAAAPATLSTEQPGVWAVGGAWTGPGVGAVALSADGPAADPAPTVLDGSGLVAIDSAGAWVLQRWLRARGVAPTLRGWPARAQGLMEQVQAGAAQAPLPMPRRSVLQHIGRKSVAAGEQALPFVAFVARSPGHASTVARQNL